MQRERAQAQLRFEILTSRLSSRIASRLYGYEQILRSGVAVFDTWGDVSRDQWRSFVARLDLPTRLQAVRGIGFAEIIAPEQLAGHVARVRSEGFPNYAVHPSGARPIYSSILYLEPFDQENRRAFGFDMLSEPVRRSAMEVARDSGEATLSGKVRLVQETETDVQAGFLMYLPVYRGGGVPATIEERRARLRGYVYAPFRAGDFTTGVFGRDIDIVHLQVFAGTEPTSDNLLFDSQAGGTGELPEAELGLLHEIPLQLPNQLWTIRLAALPAAHDEYHSYQPTIIASGGTVISALLFLITWSVTRSNDRLREQETQLRYLFEKNPSVMWVYDRNSFEFIEVNDAAMALYGYSREEFVRMKVTDLRPSSEVARFKEHVHALPDGLRRSGEWHHRTKNGRELTVDITSYTLQYAGRDASLVVVRDVTDLKEAQEQLQQAQKMESIGRLTGGIAHDFNNLLTVIVGSAEILAEDPAATDHQRKLAKMMFSAAERGAELTRSMLAFARRQPLKPKVIDVNQVVSGMEMMLRRALGEDVDIRFRMAQGLWTALTDANQLETAILNLAVNARDAMAGGGMLTIETANRTLDEDYAAHNADVRPGNYVMIAVSDTGTGMTAEVLEHAFDPYFTTKPVGRGTGLGLSMVFGFVKQSGGHIKAYSEPGHGTTIRIYLPRHAADDGVEAPAPAGRETAPAGAETILVVEDDKLVRSYVEDQLGMLGYTVVVTPDGASALDVLADSRPFDLLLTDVIMPGGMTGRDLADRASKMRPGIKVLFMSGYAENALAHHGRVDPGVHLLNKPFRRHELAAKVREVLDG